MKRLILLLSIITAVCMLAGCVDQNPQKSDGSDNRVVATSYATVCICDLLELDLVGIPTTSFELPNRYEGITEVGSAMGPDKEIISSLRPTDIIGPDTLIDSLKASYDELGLTSTFLNLRSVEGLYDSIRILGDKYGKQPQADAAITEYENKLKELNKLKGEKQGPKVLLLMGFPGSYCQATNSSYIGDLSELAGAINVVETTEADFVNINTEELIGYDPDFILWTAHAMPEKVAEMFDKEFSENDVWKNFRAVQNGNVIHLDEDLFSMSANFQWDEALETLFGIFYGAEYENQ